MKYFITFFLAFSLLLFVLNTTPVSACSCYPGPLLSSSQYDAIFSGRVDDMQYNVSPDRLLPDKENSYYRAIKTKEGEIMSLSPESIRFTVYTAYKGINGKNAIITPEGFGTCEQEFEKGKEYLVFAYKDKNDLKVSLCGHTKQLSDAKNDIALLMKIMKIVPLERKLFFLTVILIIASMGIFIGYRIIIHIRKKPTT